MKRNKLMKKALAILVAMSVIFAMSISAFATIALEDTNIPSDADTDTITVSEVEVGATATAYQIVKGSYNDAGLIAWVPNIDGTVTIPTDGSKVSLTPAQVGVLAGKAIDGELTESYSMTDNKDGTYSATVPAGLYLVLITGTNDTIYNPVLLAVGYEVDKDGNNATKVEVVSALSNYENDAYVKSSKPKVDKKIVDSGNNSNGDDVAFGSTVKFEIDTTIPSYNPGRAKEVTFNIEDTMDAGLDLTASSIKVTVGGEEVAASTDTAKTYTLTTEAHGFTIEFDDAYILANGLKDVVVTYSAVVNENATYNYDPNKNTGKITYSRTPGTEKGYKEDTTYHYTFGIDADLGGTKEGWTTHELVKTEAPNGAAEYDPITDEWTVTDPLAGATFKLTPTDGTPGEAKTATSDKDGLLQFLGLDAGKYDLVETKAPAGYAVDTVTHKVVISASYNDDGTLASYSITIDGEATSTYSCDYTKTPPEVKVEKAEATVIQNTPIPSLPSTGSIGTYLFTLVGVLIMTCGAVMFIRRRSAAK